MTQQISFSEIEYDAKKKQTRRDVFLAKMETIVPFARLVALIAPHYPTSGRRGRPPLGNAEQFKCCENSAVIADPSPP
jgi:IS5 family transposase